MKKWQKTALVLFLCVLATFGGGYAAYKGYRHMRQVRLLHQAKAYLEKSQEQQALLCLRRALSIDDRDVGATRLMVQIMETSQSPAALLWRSRVVELTPKSFRT